MDPLIRLSKIRSILKEAEKILDRVDLLKPENQLPVLREAFVSIILAAGPQPSGKKREHNDKDDKSKRTGKELRGSDSDFSRSTTSRRKPGAQLKYSHKRRTICRKSVVNFEEDSGRAERYDQFDQFEDCEDGSCGGGLTIGSIAIGIRTLAEKIGE